MTGTLFTFLYVFNFTKQQDINPFHFFTCLFIAHTEAHTKATDVWLALSSLSSG